MLKTQSHKKLQDLADLANKLVEMRDKALGESKWTLAEVIASEQERVGRVRRLAINAHQRVWG